MGSSARIRLLHVDDGGPLSLDGCDDRFDVDAVGTAAAALDCLGAEPYDCVVSEYDLPATDGVALLGAVREAHPGLPFVLFTGAGSETVASEAISAGVTDYFPKADTDRRRLAARIVEAVERRSEERTCRTVCETLPHGVVVHDPRDGSLTDVNGRVAELLGYDREELLAAGFEAFLLEESPHDLEEARRRIRAAAEDGPRAFEWPCVTREGERLWTEVHLAPIDLDGRRQVLAVVEDVTDRRERERELRSYETIVEAIDDAVYVLDADGTIRFVNESYAEMKGVPKSDLHGTSIDRWASDDVVERVRGMTEAIERDERDAGKLEYEFRTAGGDRIPAELRFTVLEFPDGERGRVGVIRDVRERVAREHELERTNERLDEFASIVSHDLRNPLNVLEGGLELAAETGDPSDLARCRRAVDRMGQLVDDLLALARSGDADLNRSPVSLASVTDRCWGAVDTADASLETTANATIRADEGHLRRLFENLFRNAVEHGSTNPRSETREEALERRSAAGETAGRVTVTVGALPDGFYVADDGPGIPASERDRVFESGYANGHGGTGLGLSIVRRIAEAHGWTVAVTESQDGGARFEFTGVETPRSADRTPGPG